MDPAPGYWGLFGLNTVPPKAKTIVITEGEYDAMAVYEATGLPAISLPNEVFPEPVPPVKIVISPFRNPFIFLLNHLKYSLYNPILASNFIIRLNI